MTSTIPVVTAAALVKSLRDLARNFTRIAEDIEHWPEDESLPGLVPYAFEFRYLDLQRTGGSLLVEAVKAGYLQQFADLVAWHENTAANEEPLPPGKARILRCRENLFCDVVGIIGRLGPGADYRHVPVKVDDSGRVQLDKTEAPNLMRILADPASDQASRRYAARCIRVSTARLEAWVADHLADMIEREAATPAGAEQPWRDGAPEYVSLSEACRLFDGALHVKTLSRLLVPDGEVRHMRKGRRCKVHLGDLRRFLARRSDPKAVEALAAYFHAPGRGLGRVCWSCKHCGIEWPDGPKAATKCPQCGAEAECLFRTAPRPAKAK